VTADSVTEKQIKQAQDLLNEIAAVKNNHELNQILLEVFAVIPRRMGQVKDHLYNESDDFLYSVVEEVIGKEQELLDSMAQQVKQVELVNDNTNDKLTLLDAMGIEIFNVDAKQEAMIRGKLADLKDNYIRAFKVHNKKTQARFDKFITKADNKKTDLFFHGSRNENWLPILQTGLVLRPTNAVITGKMFGYGTYYADKAQKSWGYTSARGSYWARGAASEAYMALFNVHLGNQLHIKRHEGWCSGLDLNKLKARGNYDSLFAQGGYDLRNNEFIVYTEDQSTVEFLIQMKG
jgi:poly [ADP-ribose] polymerase